MHQSFLFPNPPIFVSYLFLDSYSIFPLVEDGVYNTPPIFPTAITVRYIGVRMSDWSKVRGVVLVQHLDDHITLTQTFVGIKLSLLFFYLAALNISVDILYTMCLTLRVGISILLNTICCLQMLLSIIP